MTDYRRRWFVFKLWLQFEHSASVQGKCIRRFIFPGDGTLGFLYEREPTQWKVWVNKMINGMFIGQNSAKESGTTLE
jgi:hypothetical protein